jgi:hypothetical protein
LYSSKSSIFWVMKPCNSLKVNGYFGGACRLHLQGRTWNWRRHDPSKRRLTCNGLRGVISQKTGLFITTVVRTSAPTYIRIAYIQNLPKFNSHLSTYLRYLLSNYEIERMLLNDLRK